MTKFSRPILAFSGGKKFINLKFHLYHSYGYEHSACLHSQNFFVFQQIKQINIFYVDLSLNFCMKILSSLILRARKLYIIKSLIIYFARFGIGVRSLGCLLGPGNMIGKHNPILPLNCNKLRYGSDEKICLYKVVQPPFLNRTYGRGVLPY